MDATPMTEIQKMTDRHRAIMRDMVLLGMRSCDVSVKYGMSEHNVSIIINSPLWKKESAAMHDEAVSAYKGRVMTMTPKALDTVEEIMSRTSEITVKDKDGKSMIAHVSNPPATRVRAAELVLKSVGIVGDRESGGGNKSIVINLLQPGWGSPDGKPSAINIEVDQ